MLNEILIRRKSCVLIPTDHHKLDGVYVGTILHGLARYGYTLNAEAVAALRKLSVYEAEEFYTDAIATIRKLVGADKQYEPMYPNFPRQVMEAPAAELLINAVLHYFGDCIGIRIMPKYDKAERPPLFEHTELTVLAPIGPHDVQLLFTNLLASKTSLSATDQADLSWYLKEHAGNLTLPDVIPHKEVLAFLVQTLGLGRMQAQLKTATDVLRAAVALSGGDVSLATPTKFRSFKRSERRTLLQALESCFPKVVRAKGDMVTALADMARHRGAWVKLGHGLHVGEYKYNKKYPNAVASFRMLRSGKTIPTDRSALEACLQNQDVKSALTLLRAKPGELARRLDHLLRLSWTGSQADDPAMVQARPGDVIAAFERVADSVSTPVLLQALAHFQNRNVPRDLRAIFPKGNVAKVKALPNELPPLDDSITSRVRQVCQAALIKRFAVTSPLPTKSRVYIHPDLINYLVPFSQRSASRALHTIVRGSRLPLTAKQTLRFFIWWHDINYERVDVDLSVVLYRDDWSYSRHVSYTQLRSDGLYHSGDITSAPDGACEFIDLDVSQILQKGERYALPAVLSYSCQVFTDMPECYFGWMARTDQDSGEVFEPQTVQQKIDLTADTRLCIPAVIDLVMSELVWADIALKNQQAFANNIESNKTSLALMGKALTQMCKPNLGQLFGLHCKAREVELVDVSERETADVILGIEKAYDFDDIAANWL
jgi:hypothetical protein